MTETIDTKEWLPRNTPVVNRFRMNHGDMEGFIKGEGAEAHIAHAQVRDRSILASLINRGFLEDYHHTYAMGFLELQHAFTSKQRHKLNSVYMDQLLGGRISSAVAEALYLKTIRSLGNTNVRIIERACNAPAESDQACKVMVGINVYMDCMNKLVHITDDLKADLEKIKEQCEKELECL